MWPRVQRCGGSAQPRHAGLEQADTADEAFQVLKELFDHYGEDRDICLAFTDRAAEMDYLTNADGSRVSYKELRKQHQGGTMAEAQQTRFEEFYEGHRKEAKNEGRQEGHRESLCRLAAMKFNGRTSKQLATLLKAVDDPMVFDQVAEKVIACDTGKKFIDACKRLDLS